MKSLLLKIFTWWNGQTLNTQVWTWLYGELVGTDEFGNRYYRTKGGKLELTSIPANEWKTVEDAALVFWDEIAKKSPRSAKVVQILKDYRATMEKAGPPYRYG